MTATEPAATEPATEPAAPNETGSDIAELAVALRTLTLAIDRIENGATGQSGTEFLAAAVSGCVRLVGLLAALAGVLRQLAQQLADAPAAGQPLAEVVLDLGSMRALLHRALLVAAPALADLRNLVSPTQRRQG